MGVLTNDAEYAMLNTSEEQEQAKEYIFSQETIDSLVELGEVLKKIHIRMLSEGYIFENDKFIRPNNEIDSTK